MAASKGRVTVGSPESPLCLNFAGGLCAGRTSIVLSKKNVSLGRGEECDIVLDGDTVSRRHCSITQWGAAYVLLDSSRNGTFVNGERVAQVHLRDGDEIRVGQNLLVASISPPSGTQALVRRSTTPHRFAPVVEIKPHIVVKGLEEGVTQPFGEDRITIGRRADNHLVIDGDNISRQHVAIERRGGEYFLTDLGSANGTYVNDARIAEAPLRDGDRVRVGYFTFSVSLRERDCILNFKKPSGA